MNLKKIIAREGLIIIFLVAISAICFFLDHLQSTYHSKRIVPNLKELQTILNQVKIIDEKHIICPGGQKIESDSKPNNEDIYWACTAGVNEGAKDLSIIPDKQLFELANIPMGKRPFVQRIDFLSLALFFLIGAYPLYLLFRFIFWATKVLREK